VALLWVLPSLVALLWVHAGGGLWAWVASSEVLLEPLLEPLSEASSEVLLEPLSEPVSEALLQALACLLVLGWLSFAPDSADVGENGKLACDAWQNDAGGVGWLACRGV